MRVVVGASSSDLGALTLIRIEEGGSVAVF